MSFGGGKRRLVPNAPALTSPSLFLELLLYLCTSPPTAVFTLSGAIASLLVPMAAFSIRAFIPPLTRRCFPFQATRRYAVQAPGAPTLEIFSNQHKWQQKERAASDTETSRSVDYLRDEVASRLCERVLVGSCASRWRITPNEHRISIATFRKSSTSVQTRAI